MTHLWIEQESELPSLAKQLRLFAGAEKFFVFEGGMAAGKTTFIKAFCAELGVEDGVSSPTFSIVNEYTSPKGVVYHFDFYRIKSLQEAYDIGYEEYFYSGSYCLVEWPQLVESLLPSSYIRVGIRIEEDGRRSFEFSKMGA